MNPTNTCKKGDEHRYLGRVSSSCSTCSTRRVTLVTNTVISHTMEQLENITTMVQPNGKTSYSKIAYKDQ